MAGGGAGGAELPQTRASRRARPRQSRLRGRCKCRSPSRRRRMASPRLSNAHPHPKPAGRRTRHGTHVLQGASHLDAPLGLGLGSALDARDLFLELRKPVLVPLPALLRVATVAWDIGASRGLVPGIRPLAASRPGLPLWPAQQRNRQVRRAAPRLTLVPCFITDSNLSNPPMRESSFSCDVFTRTALATAGAPAAAAASAGAGAGAAMARRAPSRGGVLLGGRTGWPPWRADLERWAAGGAREGGAATDATVGGGSWLCSRWRQPARCEHAQSRAAARPAS